MSRSLTFFFGVHIGQHTIYVSIARTTLHGSYEKDLFFAFLVKRTTQNIFTVF